MTILSKEKQELIARAKHVRNSLIMDDVTIPMFLEAVIRTNDIHTEED